jgi:uncharacterized OsmC-like protein
MKDAELKDLYERRRRAFARRPAFARGSGAARAVLVDGGCAVDVAQGSRVLRVECPEDEGGPGGGAHPGELLRASLAAELALGYRAWGARLGVAIDDVAVEVVSEHDARGELGLADDVGPAWQRVFFDVRVTSGAPEDDVRRVIDVANRRSPALANLSSSVARAWRVSIARR